MNGSHRKVIKGIRFAATALAVVLGSGCSQPKARPTEEPIQLTHQQTLAWIDQHRAWRRAVKAKPMWARPVEPAEVGTEFQTADRAIERAREGYWLCVGVAGEPWFQKPERIEARYDRAGEETKQFTFDSQPRSYRVYKPKGTVYSWAAQVKGPGIAGFFIKPNYDVDHPLYSPAGGYVVKDDVDDPYRDKPNDVWLVQETIFNDSYEWLP
jgi:hypothetical protein